MQAEKTQTQQRGRAGRGTERGAEKNFKKNLVLSAKHRHQPAVRRTVCTLQTYMRAHVSTENSSELEINEKRPIQCRNPGESVCGRMTKQPPSQIN